MKLPKPASIIAALLLICSCISFAQENKITIGPALGNDVAAYGKVFGINPKPQENKREWKGQKLPSDYIWFDEVPKLGKIKVRWTEASPVVVYTAVSFPDKAVMTWQSAFEGLGLPTEGKVAEQTADAVRIIFPTENGKSCTALFYQKDPKGQTKGPVIELIVK